MMHLVRDAIRGIQNSVIVPNIVLVAPFVALLVVCKPPFLFGSLLGLLRIEDRVRNVGNEV